MAEFLLNALIGVIIGVISLGIGYLFSRQQSKELVKTAKEILRSFEVISLRDEFYMTHILAGQIRSNSFFPDLIIAITPGGGMVGEWLSRRFLGDRAKPIPMCSVWIDTVRDSEGRHLSPPKACASLSSSLPKVKNILLVNDISKSGQTLGVAIEFAKGAFQDSTIKAAVLFLSQDAGPPYPDFWVNKPWRWVDFEWKRGT